MPSKATVNKTCLVAFAQWMQALCKPFFSGTEKNTRQILVISVLSVLFSTKINAGMVNAGCLPDLISPFKCSHPFLILRCRSFYIKN